MQHKIKRGVRISLCLLLITLSVGALLYVLRPPQLMERASLVGQLTEFDNSFHWISNREILYNGPSKASQYRPIYSKDIYVGKVTLLPNLTQKLKLSNDNNLMYGTKVSPDGKWLLCYDSWQHFRIVSIDGTFERSFTSKYTDRDMRTEFFWTSDSRFWMEAYTENPCCEQATVMRHLILHDTQNPDSSQELDIDKELYMDSNPRFNSFLAKDRIVFVEWPIEKLRDRMLFEEKSITSGELMKLTITIASIKNKGTVFATHTLQIPSEVERTYFEISPDCKHVAWLFKAERSDSYLDWLHKYIPGIKPVKYARTSLWVSDIDGRMAHEVGRMDEPVDTSKETSTPFDLPVDHTPKMYDLQWLPSGKALSFGYEKKLYTVPAE